MFCHPNYAYSKVPEDFLIPKEIKMKGDLR